MKRTLTVLFMIALLTAITLTASAGEIRIISYNVWHGIDGVGTFKFDEYEKPEVRKNRYRLLEAGLKSIEPGHSRNTGSKQSPVIPQKAGRHHRP